MLAPGHALGQFTVFAGAALTDHAWCAAASLLLLLRCCVLPDSSVTSAFCRERLAMEGEMRQMQVDMQALVEADLEAQQVLFCCHVWNTSNCTL